MAPVVLEAVSKVYGGSVKAVDRIDLEVRDKEFLVLLGPSGCGKTTTLRMIAGLEEPTEGRILIDGRLVNGVPPKDRDIAMVFQNYALYPHMTVYKNMAFGLELRGGSNWLRRAFWSVVRPKYGASLRSRHATIADRVKRIAMSLGIEHLLSRRPDELSGGERQRVALGRAIVREPAAFLFDEPLSNLDARLRLEMRRELKQLHHDLEATMIYVTHDQAEAMTLGQRIAVFNRGRIQQADTPLMVYDQPANRFVASFVGTPPMNFIAGHLIDQANTIVFQAEGWSVPVDKKAPDRVQRNTGRRLILGIRPEHVKLGGRDISARGDQQLRGTTVLVEPLGDAEIVHLKLGLPTEEIAERGTSLVAKGPPRSGGRVGEQVSVEFDMAQAHLFDADTGENLTRSSQVNET